MTAPQKFRSALNGFNREDVVRYIEFSNSRHEAEVTQLKEQLEFYRKELAAQSAAAQQAENDRAAELEQKCAELEAENETLRQQLTEASQKQSSVDEELEAYRRAERAERMAKTRVSQMYAQANAAIADTAANLDVAAADLGKQVITNAAVALGAIRPGTEEE